MEMQSRVEGVQCSNDMGAQGCSQCKGLRHPSLRDRMGAEINQGIHFNEEEFDASKMSKRERESIARRYGRSKALSFEKRLLECTDAHRSTRTSWGSPTTCISSSSAQRTWQALGIPRQLEMRRNKVEMPHVLEQKYLRAASAAKENAAGATWLRLLPRDDVVALTNFP